MSPDKYLRLFEDLRPIVARKYRGASTRVDFQKPAARDRDRVIVAKRPADDARPDRDALDDVLRRCGLRPLGHDWEQRPPEAARAHLATALSQSLLEPRVATMERRRATEVANSALTLLPDARFYTNGPFPPRKPTRAFPSITEALQDTGLAVVNDTTIAVIWIQEDD